jgi:lipid A disaccharide synthetase
VIEQNLPWMLDAAARLRKVEPEVRVVVVQERRELLDPIEAAIERAEAGAWAVTETGDLHATLARARCALSVSGTVLLDLLHHRLPAVVLYRLSSGRAEWASRRFLTVPFFSSVNLLVGREVYPEFAFHGAGPVAEIDAVLRRAWGDEGWRAECVSELDRASALLGPAGACDRAALQVLDLALRGKTP